LPLADRGPAPREDTPASGGLTLIRGMITQFWDRLYPEIEDGDLELRATPLEWLGGRLDFALKSSPINKNGHTHYQYKESTSVPTEKDAEQDEKKGKQRQKALEDGKISADMFEKGFEATPKVWFRQLPAT
jgi:type VI secretion system protein ImpA